MQNLDIRHRLRIEGIVQGVGFRPFIHRLATQLALRGWVMNDSQGVLLEVEGEGETLERFETAIRQECPPLAHISRMQIDVCPSCGDRDFQIIASRETDEQTAQIPPDTYVCPDCLRELFDKTDRRYGYPFINCTNCGPRYSIVNGVPYDRPKTTMADFPMCRTCLAEYQDPGSRRFHAQPNACADCGPQLALHDADGRRLETADPLEDAILALKQGLIVAIKGLGGYHLAVDPTNATAVARLRRRKCRDEKPFALMARDLESAASFVHFDTTEKQLLTSVERPIVLLQRRIEQTLICEGTAPGNRYLGVMLPCTPLHHLILQHVPVLIMTSGNQSDEPIAYEENDAFSRLKGIADLYLSHNRRIHIRTDDAIVRLLSGRPLLLRRSRGYVPRAVKLSGAQISVLALGAELKNSICLTRDDRATLSQHIGDLKNLAVLASLQQAISHLQQLLHIRPRIIAHDLHPDYVSTRVAQEIAGVPKVAVQHHHAHLASCLADNGRDEKAIGVIFDGIGYGSDGHIWGGEFLLGDFGAFRRLGHLTELPMPGGDAASREPWRMAQSLLFSVYGADLPEVPALAEVDRGERKLLLQMLEKKLNTPMTSSCGRLFDAVSALCGLRHKISFEGQAALDLEMALEPALGATPYTFELITHDAGFCLGYATMVRQLVRDLKAGRATAEISLAFHLGLARGIVMACRHIRDQYGPWPVALSGGVFQNVFLAETTHHLLQQADFEVLLHRQVPPNDGGLALGQAVIAAAQIKPPDAWPVAAVTGR